MVDKRPRIIDVMRKPQKCPVCGERVVDIIYGAVGLKGRVCTYNVVVDEE